MLPRAREAHPVLTRRGGLGCESGRATLDRIPQTGTGGVSSFAQCFPFTGLCTRMQRETLALVQVAGRQGGKTQLCPMPLQNAAVTVPRSIPPGLSKAVLRSWIGSTPNLNTAAGGSPARGFQRPSSAARKNAALPDA